MKNFKKIIGIFSLLFMLGGLTCSALSSFGYELSPVLSSIFGIGTVGAMTAGIITPADITWNGKEVQSITEATFETIYKNPQLNAMHSIVENIVAKQQIAFLGLLSKITKKDTGCGTSPTSATIGMTEKSWEPEPVEFWLADCVNTLEESFFIWGTGKGIKRDDLTVGDYSDFITERMGAAILEDAMRIVWFGDTDAADVDASPAGVLTSGTDLTDYNIIDGLWAQIFDDGAVNTDRKNSIALNAEATYANQAFDSTDTTNRLATSILQDVVDDADDRLKEAPNKALYVTGSIYDQYKRELKSFTNIEAAYMLLQDGTKQLSFDGIPLIPVRFWDRTIKADFDNGTSYYKPHRVLLTVKENIPVGIDSAAALKSIEAWYERKDKKTHWRGGYKIDAKLLESYMYQAAY